MRESLYSIRWLPEALKQFKKIKDRKLQERILEIIETKIAANPLIGKPLTFELKGVRSYRVGRLRILYKQYKKILTITVIRIDHRKNVYRKK